jgi:hypothetical protein
MMRKEALGPLRGSSLLDLLAPTTVFVSSPIPNPQTPILIPFSPLELQILVELPLGEISYKIAHFRS